MISIDNGFIDSQRDANKRLSGAVIDLTAPSSVDFLRRRSVARSRDIWIWQRTASFADNSEGDGPCQILGDAYIARFAALKLVRTWLTTVQLRPGHLLFRLIQPPTRNI